MKYPKISLARDDAYSFLIYLEISIESISEPSYENVMQSHILSDLYFKINRKLLNRNRELKLKFTIAETAAILKSWMHPSVHNKEAKESITRVLVHNKDAKELITRVLADIKQTIIAPLDEWYVSEMQIKKYRK